MAGSGTTLNGTTAAPQGRQTEETPQRSSGAAWLVVGVVVGAVMTTIAGWTLHAGEFKSVAEWLNSVLNLLPAALGGFGVALLLAVLLAWWALRRFVGKARGTIEQIISDTAEATRAAAKSDAPAAVSHAERALREAAAWYGPAAARRFVVHTLVTLLVTFGGLVGTGLLFRQTILLDKQNEKLGEQTALLRDQNAKLGPADGDGRSTTAGRAVGRAVLYRADAVADESGRHRTTAVGARIGRPHRGVQPSHNTLLDCRGYTSSPAPSCRPRP
jgi:hypothetical protein